MTYHKPYEYTERYFVQFDDVDGNKWRISIQDPNFDGDPTELTGASVPVEWEGRGDESQDEVVLGSTGKLRLVILEGQSPIFTNGNLFPTNINDRRVQISREMSQDVFDIYWQGFIEPSTYSQDYDRIPYEIEIPIISAIAASECFPLPDMDDANVLETATNVGALLSLSIDMLGCDYVEIYTNKPDYEDFNGDKSLDNYGRYRHWTEGKATFLDFYDLSSGYSIPMTVKDLLERICYPYGKIYEYGRAIVISMSWRDSASGSAYWYSIPIYDTLQGGGIDYDIVITSPQRFVEAMLINIVSLSDILTADTDNTQSIIPMPRSVKYSNNCDGESSIFELTDDYLSPNIPVPYYSELTYEREYNKDSKQHRRNHYRLGKSNIDYNAFTRGGFGPDAIDGIEVTTNATDGSTAYPFCRVSEMSYTTNTNVESSIITPLAFLFDFGQTTQSNSIYTIRFNLKRPIFTNPSYNQIKLSIKAYRYLDSEPMLNMTRGNETGGVTFYVKDITDSDNPKYFVYRNEVWQWDSSQGWISGYDLPKEGDEYVLRFNEDRTGDDPSIVKNPHILQVCLRGLTDRTKWSDRFYATLKIEYEETSILFTNRGLYEICPPNRQIGSRTTKASSGEDIDIDFKTKCLRSHFSEKTAPQHLSNSFCDAQKYIDMQNRNLIELDAVQFTRYNGIGWDKFDIVSRPVVIVEGANVFIPVAVGMNPRMNTIKLKLVSTNVTSS